jgi:hypothetical protein
MSKELKLYINDIINLKFNYQSSSKDFLYFDLLHKGINLQIKRVEIKGNNPYVIIEANTPESITVNEKWKFHKDKNSSRIWKLISQYEQLLHLNFPAKETFYKQKNFCLNMLDDLNEAEIYLRYLISLKEYEKSLPIELFLKAQYILDKIILFRKKYTKIYENINKNQKIYKKNHKKTANLFMEKALELLSPEQVNQIFQDLNN